MSKTILVTGTSLVPAEARAYIEARGYSVRYIEQDSFTSEELHRALNGVGGYLIGGYEEPLPEHFEKAESLEAVAWVGTDYKSYVPGWQRAYELGIAFLNSPGTNAVSVAEFTVLLALSMSRPFTTRVAIPGEPPADLGSPGTDLAGRWLGIVGLGRIGACVARIAKFGFGMEVAYTGPRRHEAAENALGIAYLQKPELLASSDVVTIHRPGPLPDEGYELGIEEFDALKNSAIVVNTAHHGLIDLGELAKAIESKGVRAAFDGVSSGAHWDRLVALGPDRFLAVPSMAFNSSDANLRASLRTAQGVCDVLDGLSSDDVNNPNFRDVRRERHD